MNQQAIPISCTACGRTRFRNDEMYNLGLMVRGLKFDEAFTMYLDKINFCETCYTAFRLMLEYWMIDHIKTLKNKDPDDDETEELDRG